MANDDEPLAIASAVLPDFRAAYKVRDALEITADAVHGADSETDEDEALIAGVARLATCRAHKRMLEDAVHQREVTVLNALDKTPHTLPLGEALMRALIPRDELQRFARRKLRIDLKLPASAGPVFTTSARPLTVPPELLALDDDTPIEYEHTFGTLSGVGWGRAADYRVEIEEAIARQAEGYFTLDEAAQVLADARPGLSAAETVERFRVAHRKGVLPIHKRGSRFPLEAEETVHDFHDLLQVSELDAWLRKSAGYGFPTAPVGPTEPPTPKVESAAGWKETARDEARRIRAKRFAKLGTYPNLAVLGDEVAKEFRLRGITGSNGHALNGSYIRRHALIGQGITKPADKLRSTLRRRGK